MKRPLLVTVMLLCLGSAATSFGLTIDFGAPNPAVVNSGASTSVPILVSGAPANLLGLSFWVGYDPTVLQFDAFPPPTGVPAFAPGLFGTQTDGVPGFVNVSVPSGDFSLLGPAFTLTDLTFLGVGVGTSALTFLSDADHQAFADILVDPINFVTEQIVPTLGLPGSVSAVPEPGTLVLLGSGLMALARSVRARKRA